VATGESEPSADSASALLIGLDPAQAEAVSTPAAPLRILAGAGSGKTRVLTRRIAYRIETGQADGSHTMAVTFTRRAAAELRGRLRRLSPAAADVAAGTFHGLAWAQYQQWLRDSSRPVPHIVASPSRIVRRYASGDELPGALRALADGDPGARARYEEEKRRRGVIDFDDVLTCTTAELRDSRRFADAVRWRFRHLYVDEFQDVNPAQYALLQAWLGGRDEVCVVGDPNQAVYGWNGADPTLLDRLDGFHTVRLDANYRSTAEIVRAAALALGRAATPATAGGRSGPSPTIAAYPDDEAEATAVARAVRLAHAPTTAWSHIAVLARTNAQLDVVAEALTRAGIPVRRPGTVAPLDRPAVKQALSRLPVAAPATEAAHRLRSLMLDEPDPADAAAVADAAELAVEFEAVSPGGSTAAFLAWLPSAREADALRSGPGGGVDLATFHKAKGLEWPTVFLVGVQDGLVPLPRGDQAEERRLLYVAMTRAERVLHISRSGPPSPFLPDAVLAPAPALPPVDAKAELARLRRRLAEAS
jgi:DNA helicase-2/ATP-dependent DNA helicase PcrA